MLAAIVLAVFVSIGMILIGAGLMLLAISAEASAPIPGRAKAGGVLRAGVVLFAMGAALLALTLWPDPADAGTTIRIIRTALV